MEKKEVIRQLTPIFEEAKIYDAIFEREGNEIIDYVGALHKLAIKHNRTFDNHKDETVSSKMKSPINSPKSRKDCLRSISLPAISIDDEIKISMCYRSIINLMIELNSMITDNIIQYLKYKDRHKFIKELLELDATLDDIFDIIGLKKIKLLSCFEKYGYSLDGEIISIREFATNVDISHDSYYNKKQKELKKKLIVPKEPEKIHMNDYLDDFNFWNFNSEKNTRMIILLQNLNNLKLEIVINSWEGMYPKNRMSLVIIQRAFERYIEKFICLFSDLADRKIGDEKIDKMFDNAGKLIPKALISM